MAVDGRGVLGGEKSPELDVIGDWSSGVAGGGGLGHVPSLGGWRWGCQPVDNSVGRERV